jgi:hypothetical protein
VDFEEMGFMTVKDLCNQPFVFRFDSSAGEHFYFAGTESLYLEIKDEKKNIKRMLDLVEYWREGIIMRGFPSDVSILNWRLKDASVQRPS